LGLQVRKRAIALWRFLEPGMGSEGAILGGN
jgi:hypothetical protein